MNDEAPVGGLETAVAAEPEVCAPERSTTTSYHGLVAELEAAARRLRRDVVQMIGKAGSGHPGGSLSSADIIAVLYWRVLRHDPANPTWPDRDRFILSKGHAAPILYAALAEQGYFPMDALWTLRQFGSILQGHTDSTVTPGVELSAGSLGQGLSFGIGCAIAARLKGQDYRVHVLLGDGECQEGQVWEAAMSAANFGLDNLVAIVDRNNQQNDNWVHLAQDVKPLGEKWRAFKWHVVHINGHSVPQLLDAFTEAKTVKGRPTVIIGDTVKGKGVSFIENNLTFHGKAPTKEQVEQGLLELAD